MTIRTGDEVSLFCVGCGASFIHIAGKGARPKRCQECRATGRVRPASTRTIGSRYNMPRQRMVSVGEEMASNLIRYRLAIEEATYALRSDQPLLALTVLEKMEAPARDMVQGVNPSPWSKVWQGEGEDT